MADSNAKLLEAEDAEDDGEVRLVYQKDAGTEKRKKRFVVLIVSATILALTLFFAGFGFGFLAFGRNSNSKHKEQGDCSWDRTPLLLISLDGFRRDYLSRGKTPTLFSLASEGVTGTFLQSQFPTKTFPNHYSIATGLYPESHGIVANRFYDPRLDDTFSIGGKTSLSSKWWLGEPIWVTAEKSDVTTGIYFWPGSDVEIGGFRPTHYFKYNGSVPWSQRVDTVLGWLDMPATSRPEFMMLYLEEPDHTGHLHGPGSDEVNVALTNVDKALSRLFDGIAERNIKNCVNVIVVADHGMTEISPKRVLYLSDMLSADTVTLTNHGPFAFIDSALGVDVPISDIYRHLKSPNISKVLQTNAQFYLKEHMPKRFHYSNNERISPIVGLANLGWYILSSPSSYFGSMKGTHGYDNREVDMEALFVAAGPSFKKGYVVDGFPNIELYNLICQLLRVEPAPNNGTLGSLHEILSDASRLSVEPKSKASTLKHVGSCSLSTSFAGYVADDETICSENKVSFERLSGVDARLVAFGYRESFVERHLPWGVPTPLRESVSTSCVLTQEGFITGYSSTFRIPRWVAYRLDGKDISKQLNPLTSFRSDPRLGGKSATCRDYSGITDFSKGQLASPDDFIGNGTAAVAETFLLSNVAPQHPSLANGPWKSLNELTQFWAVSYGTVYVLAGTVFDANGDGLADDETLMTRWMKDNGSSIATPTHFFKTILRCKDGEFLDSSCSGTLEAMPFVFGNFDWGLDSNTLQGWMIDRHVASIRDVALLTGMDFFPSMSDVTKARWEVRVHMSLWT